MQELTRDEIVAMLSPFPTSAMKSWQKEGMSVDSRYSEAFYKWLTTIEHELNSLPDGKATSEAIDTFSAIIGLWSSVAATCRWPRRMADLSWEIITKLYVLKPDMTKDLITLASLENVLCSDTLMKLIDMPSNKDVDN